MMCFQNVTLSLGLFNEAKHYLGKVKTKPMKWFCLAWDIRGSPRSFAGALTCALVQAAFHLLASFPSLPPILWGKYTFKTMGFLRDLLTGAWEMDCGSVAIITTLLLRRVLPSLLLPLLPSNKLA